jgi:hypothetical protein
MRRFIALVASLSMPVAALAGTLLKPNGDFPGGVQQVDSGNARVSVYAASYVPNTAPEGLVEALQQQSFTWSFTSTLTGNFRLDQNTAWANTDPAQVFYGYNFPAAAAAGLGGDSFCVGYVPGAGDPTAANARWLQVIRTNDPLGWGVTHGVELAGDPGYTWYIDNGWGGQPSPPTDPFYGADDNVNATGYAANGQGLIDAPSRDLVAFKSWEAWSFISTRSGNDITIFDGVHWGFQITSIPGPGVLAALAMAGVVAGRRRRGVR